MTIFSYMYALWVQKVGKTTKRNGKKCESKVLAILLKQFALQKSFINMTKAKQNVDTIMHLLIHVGSETKIKRKLRKDSAK